MFLWRMFVVTGRADLDDAGVLQLQKECSLLKMRFPLGVPSRYCETEGFQLELRFNGLKTSCASVYGQNCRSQELCVGYPFMGRTSKVQGTPKFNSKSVRN